MKKILIAFGTRPEAIKMCPIIKELEALGKYEVKILSTGQHGSMLDEVIKPLGICVDYDFSIMKIGQTLSYITVEILKRTEEVIEEFLPDIVLVHGDTTTAFAVGLAAFYQKVKVAHVEAGLRSGDVFNPYPEEFNRVALAKLASYHFAPSSEASENLVAEGVDASRIFITGNTVIDALIGNISKDYSHKFLPKGEKFIIFTAHRRENIDDISDIFRAVRRIAEDFNEFKVIYPIHKNEKIIRAAQKVFSGSPVKIISSLPAFDFHNFLYRCQFVITDSGGIQEEAYYLGKPALVVRKTTERKELLSKHGIKLVGTDENDIYNSAKDIIENRKFSCEKKENFILGFGDAAKKTVDALVKILG